MKNKYLTNFNIDGDAYYASPVGFFVIENDYYPSVIEFKEYINLNKLLVYLKTKQETEKEPITTYLINSDGLLCLSKGIFFLKKDLLIELSISEAQITSDEEEEESDIHNYFSRTKKKKLEKLKDVYKIYITILHGGTTPIEELQQLVDGSLEFREEPKQKGELNYLVSDESGFVLKPLKIRKVDINLSLNYGPTFLELHNYIITKLVGEENENKGLVLFHGIPGSGKTFYIRQLINELSDKKKIIYITPDMVTQISDPKFLPFLMQHRNSVLVIEDGENILKSRKGGSNQGVANLLNLADGLLGDGLDIQLICTFNCPIDDIDEALLRKGRLIAKHEFKKLEKKDAQAVLENLGVEYKAVSDMSLAEIYNTKYKSFTETKKV